MDPGRRPEAPDVSGASACLPAQRAVCRCLPPGARCSAVCRVPPCRRVPGAVAGRRPARSLRSAASRSLGLDLRRVAAERRRPRTAATRPWSNRVLPGVSAKLLARPSLSYRSLVVPYTARPARSAVISSGGRADDSELDVGLSVPTRSRPMAASTGAVSSATSRAFDRRRPGASVGGSRTGRTPGGPGRVLEVRGPAEAGDLQPHEPPRPDPA